MPHSHNCTADIQPGPCGFYSKPVCAESDDNDDSCLGPFVTSGKITSLTYPDFNLNEINLDEFNYTYCARADVYHDDGFGRQTPFTHVKRNVVVTFASPDPDTDEEGELFVDVEDVESFEYRKNEANATLIGSVFGIAVVALLISIFIIENKRRKGRRSKVERSTEVVVKEVEIV